MSTESRPPPRRSRSGHHPFSRHRNLYRSLDLAPARVDPQGTESEMTIAARHFCTSMTPPAKD